MGSTLLGVLVAVLVCLTVVFWVLLRSAPWKERVLCCIVPLSQAVVVTVYLLAASSDVVLGIIGWYTCIAVLLCIAADCAIVPGLRMSSRMEQEEASARMAAELVEACRQGSERAEQEVALVQMARQDLIREVAALSAALDEEADSFRLAENHVLASRELAAGASQRSRFCENIVADAMVSLKADKARREGVTFKVDLNIPSGLKIEDIDLCATFSNLLDNAISGALTAPEEKRSVVVRGDVRRGTLTLLVENEFRKGNRAQPPFRNDERTFDEHGWGLEILRSIAQRYDGFFETEARGSRWVSSISLRV